MVVFLTVAVVFLAVIVVFVIVVIAVVIVVDGAGDALFFQRRKSWCSCANFFVHIFTAVFCWN